MPKQQADYNRARIACALGTAGSIWLLSMALTAPVEARGGHGLHHGFGGHEMHGRAGGGSFAGDRRHDNDGHVKAASDEEDKLLNTQIKSICRGC
jgi:hypothetical protein